MALHRSCLYLVLPDVARLHNRQQELLEPDERTMNQNKFSVGG